MRVETHIDVQLPDTSWTKISHEDEWLIEEFPLWWKNRDGYVMCQRSIATKYGAVMQELRLHRIITGVAGKAGKIVDHVNRDRLDNRRANLRVATPSQNSANSESRNASGYRGVYKNRSKTSPWAAKIHKKHLKVTRTAEEAARIYDREAKKRYGQFAVLNFPDGQSPNSP